MPLQDQITRLRVLSPAVEKYISTQLYRMDHLEEELTDQLILTSCYQLVIGELKDLGIVLACDLIDVLGDFYTAESLYYLRKHFDAVSLYEVCKAHRDVRKRLNAFVQDEMIHDQDLLGLLLRYLPQRFSQHYEYHRMAELFDRLVSTRQLRDHLQAVLDHCPVIPVPAIDGESLARVLQFTKQIAEGQQAFAAAVAQVLAADETLDKVYLDRVVAQYDREKVLPCNVAMYSWAFLTDAASLAPELRPTREKYIREHQEVTSHHIEYYLAHREQRITRENLVELVCHHAEPGVTSEQFWQHIEAMLRQAQSITNPLFSEEQVAYIQAVGHILFPIADQ